LRRKAKEMEAKIKILIVDDDRDFIEISRFSLESQGYQVRAATSAKEGWRILDKEVPNLIILDLMMENIDAGMALSQKIKKEPKLSSIPILMLTSMARDTGMDFSPRNAEDLRHLQVDDFGTKPIKGKLLLEKVANLLARKKNPNP
jgi:CheY-like chemotaxis protein